ncbi:calcium-binding protein [Mesorhizobium sp. NZP2077]|uniref:DUF5801 repeats-in-toxin domain-containing protein n=1 Tax=Mesorhizobium sp. NZP2077 TaxID=2483404 RepID=UPI00155621E5|nr:DUF5801 repeats-in-toxin domain-containing protein [Mesorhizobium sp. NZP2077]QKD19394.1 calcium-binding protein [Mesorhizobium sp. NZP2077]
MTNSNDLDTVSHSWDEHSEHAGLPSQAQIQVAEAAPAQKAAPAAAEPVPVDVGSGAPVKPEAPAEAKAPAAATQHEYVADANHVVKLPANVSIDNIKVDGHNLVLEQADGSVIVIKDGALNVPTFIIGDVEVPRVALIAALEASHVDVAFGADGSISAGPGGSTSSAGGDFSVPPGGIGDGFGLSALLPPTDLAFGQPDHRELFAGLVKDSTISLTGAPPTLNVDESYLPDGSQTGPAGSTTDTLSFADIFTVAPGSGTPTISYGLSVTSQGETSNLIDSATDTAVVLTQSGNTVSGYVAGHNGDPSFLVFTLSVNTATGDVTLTQDRAVHQGSGEPGDVSEGINLVSGLVTLTATATDPGGHTASASVDIGGSATFHDDGPTITVNQQFEQPALSVDESNLSNGTTPDAALTVVTGDFHGAFTAVQGADGATVAYSLAVSAPNVDSGLIDSASGQHVLLSLNASGVVEGRTALGGDLVFTLAANTTTGVVTLSDFRAVHEGSGETPDTSEGIPLGAGLVSVTATVTDNDGDTAKASIDLGAQITIHDDGPVVTATGSAPTLSVDESFIPVIGSGTGAVGSNVSSGNFAANFAVTPGADGQSGSTAYSLTINNSTTTLVDSLTGTPVTLVQNGAGEVDGKDGLGHTVFTLTVDAAGVVTMTELRGVHEATATLGDTSEGTPLGAGLVSVTATVTDNDGDTAKASIDLGAQITIHDDGPVVTATGSAPTLSVDESFIPVIGSGTGAVGSNVSSGNFAVNFAVTPGADGQSGSTAYSLTINNSTTTLVDSLTGTPVTLVQNGAGEVDGKDGLGHTVFTLTVDAAGVVTMTELRGVHEATATLGDTSEGTPLGAGLVSVTATVTDNDGDTAKASIDLGAQITIHDDGPVVTATGSAPTLSVDESFIPVIGSGTGAVGSNVSSGNFAVNFAVTPGADGQSGSTAYSLTINNSTTTLVDSLTGTPVTLVQNGAGEVDGKDGLGHTVFTLTVDAAGVVTMTELRGVHEATATLGDTSEGTPLGAGLVSVTATVTDNDGDTAKASIDLGAQITIHDDGPVVTATGSAPTLSVDESFIPVIGSGTGAVGSNVSSGNFAVNFAVTPGADGQSGSTAYSLTINNSTTTLVDSLTGTPVTLVQNGAGEVDGKDGLGHTVFTLTVDAAGVVTMTELRGVHEATATLGDTSEGTPLGAGLVSVTATVTDNDGDTAKASIDLGAQITIHDDGPVVTATGSAPTLSVDESFIPVIGSGTGAVGSNVSSGNFAVNFAVTPGADGQSGSTAYSLTINNSTTTLVDSLTGTPVTLVQNGAGEVDGKDGLGHTVFTLTVDAAGVVTMTELRGVHEATATLGDTSEGTPLGAGLVSVTATVTDNDGDTAKASIDLGAQITIHDDGPVVTATGSAPTLSVDESFIPVIGSGTGAVGSNVSSGNFAVNFAVTPGADGQSGSTAYSLTINNSTTTLVDSLTGTPVTLVQNGAGEVDGKDGLGHTVFTLTVDAAGVVTMTELRGVHEATATLGDTSEGTPLGAGLVSVTATVTDNDGDTAKASIDLGAQITIHDDGPVVTATGSAPTLSVDESFIPVIGSGTGAVGSNVSSGNFAVNFAVTPGADGQSGSTAYSLTINNSTTTLVDSLTGTPVTLVQNGAGEVDGKDGLGHTVFTLTVDAAGVVTMTELRGVHEATATLGDTSEGTPLGAGLVSVTATVTDNDGDTAKASIDLGAQITIHDDGPVVTATGSAPTLSVDESFIPVIGSGTGAVGSNVSSGNFAVNFAVTPGADGQSGSTAYSLTINNSTTTLVDSLTGTPVTLVQNGAGEVDGKDGLGHTVFTLTVDAAGVVTMTELRGVHEATATLGDTSEGTPLGAGLVSVTATVTDNDGDTAKASIDLGAQITIHDDGPVVTATGSAPTLSVDESFIPVIGSGTGAVGSNVSSGNFAVNFAVTPGADGQSGSTAYSLTINNSTTTLVDSLTGTPVTLVQNGAGEVDGKDGLGHTVFTLTVDAAGVVTMTELRGVHEATATLGDTSEGTPLGAGLVSVTATVTDNDGDTAKASIDLGAQITIHDDGPVVTATGSAPTLSVDESFIPVIGSGTGAVGSNVSSGNFAVNFAVTPGADGQSGSTAYSLTINNSTTTLVDSLTGTPVTLVQNGAGEVDGKDGLGHTVFTLTVDAAGVVTMTELRGVHEATATLGDTSEGTPLGAGLVSVTATVTDNDGDTAKASIDLGAQITIHDDGPVVTATGSAPTLSVDESFIPVIGSGTGAVGSNVSSGNFAVNFAVTPGADGQSGSTAYSLTINNSTTTLVDSLTGTPVTLVQNGAGEVDGKDGLGHTVFTLTVDAAGVVTMTELRGVHEATATLGDTSEGTPLGAGLVSVTATVTDNDGDTAKASIDLGAQITIHDDGPVVTATGSAPTLSVDESFIPVIGSGTGAVGSNVSSGNFAANFAVTPGADGQSGSTAYSLTINNSTTTLVDSLTGTPVTLVQNGAGEVDGKDGLGHTVFTLTVDAAGVVTMTELRGVHEATATLGDTSEGTPLGAGLVSVTATVTDNDGDTAKASIDLGAQITIHDDGPVVTGIQDAIMPNVNNTDVHGTWQPTFGADGPSFTSAIGIAMGTAPAGLTYTVTDTATHTQTGEEIYSVTVAGGTTPYTFYEYVHYDPSAQVAEMFAYANPTDAQNASGANEFFTLSMNASGTYDFHLVSNSLQSIETFDLTQFKSGVGDYFIINGTTGSFQTGAIPTSGFDLLIDSGISPSTNSTHANAQGFGINNGNLDTGEVIAFTFGTTQTAVGIGIGKGGNGTTERLIVTLYDAAHAVIGTETITQADGTPLLVDAAHWGVGGTTTGSFGSFTEVTVQNAALAAGDDSKLDLTGVTFNAHAVVSSTALNFTPTITDADGDKFTSSDNLSVSLVGTQPGSGYLGTGTDATAEVIAASSGADTLNGGTGPGDTVDYSNALNSVTINLLTQLVGGAGALGDHISNFENAIGSNFADTLTANNTGSALWGGGGNDTLIGGAGSDILYGGAGLNTMTGAGGNDTFVIDPSKLAAVAMVDIIADYTPGHDVIDLSDLLRSLGGNAPTTDAQAGASIDVTFSSGAAHVMVDNNGTAAGGSMVEVASLTGVGSGSAITILYDHNLPTHTETVA